MSMNLIMQCGCGGMKIIDTVSSDGNSIREGIPVYSIGDNEHVTRCYCEVCGALFHPQSVGCERYTTATSGIMR